MTESEKIDAEFDEDWKNWKECMKDENGSWNAEKIKAEFRDLWFIYKQVGKVYMRLTGGMLSKPMYYADTIITQHEQEVTDSYQEGYNDALEAHGIKEE